MALSAADRAILRQASKIIERELAKEGDTLTISKLGVFRRVLQPPQRMRSPITGKLKDVPARLVVKFTPAKTTTRRL